MLKFMPNMISGIPTSASISVSLYISFNY